ncbi:MAG: prepilin peptidase, partial [Actinomycetota bacterium]
VLIILSAVDLEHRKIPNKILGPAAIIAVVALTGAAVGSGGLGMLKDPAIGVFAYGLPLLALAIIVPHGMGMGDVKLAGYLGWHLGWLNLLHVAVGAFAGFLVGAAAGIALMAIGRKGRKSTIPFGPAMACGTFIAVLWGKALVSVWLGGFAA